MSSWVLFMIKGAAAKMCGRSKMHRAIGIGSDGPAKPASCATRMQYCLFLGSCRDTCVVNLNFGGLKIVPAPGPQERGSLGGLMTA